MRNTGATPAVPATTALPSRTAIPSSAAPATTAAPTTAAAESTMCVASELRGSFREIPASASAGHVEARLVLTNASASPCRTYGYAGMRLLDAAGRSLPTNVVREPGAEETVLLAPGASTPAAGRFSPDIAGPGDSSTGPCQPVAVRTEVTPPDDTQQLVVPGPGVPVCEKGTLDLSPPQVGAGAGASAGA